MQLLQVLWPTEITLFIQIPNALRPANFEFLAKTVYRFTSNQSFKFLIRLSIPFARVMNSGFGGYSRQIEVDSGLNGGVINVPRVKQQLEEH